LNELLTLLQQNPKLKLEFSGHTDADGDEAANLSLSTEKGRSGTGLAEEKERAWKNLKAKGLWRKQTHCQQQNERRKRTEPPGGNKSNKNQ
jgi:hypothetical protein